MEEKYLRSFLKYFNKNKLLEGIIDINEQMTGGRKKLKGTKGKQSHKHNKHNKHNKYNISRMEPTYVEHLSEPWFTLIALGLKTVEGRKNKGKFKEMNVGDTIKWTNEDFKHRSVLTRVTEKINYNTFEEYLKTEGLQNCLPGMPNLEHGLSVYFKYFTKDDEMTYGVMAIRLELITETV